MNLDLFNVTDDWINTLVHILQYGQVSAPRGMKVYEVVGYQNRISMHNPIIMCADRKLGYRFMAAEAWWILSGRDDVASIAPYAKHISDFSDNGTVFFGAYGPKIRHQLQYVVDNLELDPDSRQAVINIWRENPPKSKDIPCTLSLQFLIRKKRLHCVATMRSSDIWLGHPYDIFNFSATAFYIMLLLNQRFEAQGVEPIELGDLILNAGSKHLYHRNFDEVEMILRNYTPINNKTIEPAFVESRYDRPQDFLDHLKVCADDPKGALSIFDK